MIHGPLQMNPPGTAANINSSSGLNSQFQGVPANFPGHFDFSGMGSFPGMNGFTPLTTPGHPRGPSTSIGFVSSDFGHDTLDIDSEELEDSPSFFSSGNNPQGFGGSFAFPSSSNPQGSGGSGFFFTSGNNSQKVRISHFTDTQGDSNDESFNNLSGTFHESENVFVHEESSNEERNHGEEDVDVVVGNQRRYSSGLGNNQTEDSELDLYDHPNVLIEHPQVLRNYSQRKGSSVDEISTEASDESYPKKEERPSGNECEDSDYESEDDETEEEKNTSSRTKSNNHERRNRKVASKGSGNTTKGDGDKTSTSLDGRRTVRRDDPVVSVDDATPPKDDPKDRSAASSVGPLGMAFMALSLVAFLFI